MRKTSFALLVFLASCDETRKEAGPALVSADNSSQPNPAEKQIIIRTDHNLSSHPIISLRDQIPEGMPVELLDFEEGESHSGKYHQVSYPENWRERQIQYNNPVNAASRRSVSAGDLSSPVELIVWTWMPKGTRAVEAKLEEAMLAGKVSSGGEARLERENIRASRRADVGQVVGALKKELQASGIPILAEGTSQPFVVVQADSETINILKQIPLVRQVGTVKATQTFDTPDPTTGLFESELDFLKSIQGLYNINEAPYNFDGGGVPIALLEDGYPDPGHPTLSQTNITYHKCGPWPWSPCASGPYDGYYRNTHTMATAHVIAGDPREDPSLTLVEKSNRMPTAMDAALHIIVGPTFAVKTDYLSGLNTPPEVFHMAASLGDDEVDAINCAGDGVQEQAVNDVFEQGIAFIKSAGNSGDSPGAWACTITRPGAATGAFLVGNARVWSSPGSGSSADVYDSSSYGFTSDTMVAVTARTSIKNMADGYTAFDSSSGLWVWVDGYRSYGGTSASSSFVAGGAVSFRNWYRTNVSSTFLDDPGMLYSALLLQSDGRSEPTGAPIEIESDPYWGAGNINFEIYDTTFQGPNWGRAYTKTCMNGGESKYYYFGGIPIESSIKRLGATAYWYDPDHGDGDIPSNIDIRLQRKIGIRWSDYLVSNHAAGNKEKVYLANPPTGYEYRLKVSVAQSTLVGNDPFCGSGRQRVYLSRFRSSTQ